MLNKISVDVGTWIWVGFWLMALLIGLAIVTAPLWIALFISTVIQYP
jgi:hypothetical protein